MFSLRSLFVGISIAAVGIAGLVYRTQAWASAMVGLTLGILAYAVIRGWLAPANTSFWRTFAVIGGTYYAIVGLEPLRGMHFNLPSTQLALLVLEKVQEPIADPSGDTFSFSTDEPESVDFVAPSDSGATATLNRRELFVVAKKPDSFAIPGAAESSAFIWIAECLWCLTLGLVAGLASSWVSRRKKS